MRRLISPTSQHCWENILDTRLLRSHRGPVRASSSTIRTVRGVEGGLYGGHRNEPWLPPRDCDYDCRCCPGRGHTAETGPGGGGSPAPPLGRRRLRGAPILASPHDP